MKSIFTYLNFWIIGAFITFTMFSCKNKTHVSQKTVLYKWLYDKKNYNTKNYKDTFYTNYQKLIANHNIMEAASLLDAFGNTLDLRFEKDSTYLATCKQFLEKYKAQLDDYHYIALHYFVGSQYEMMANNDSSIFYLKKAYKDTKDKDALQLKGFAGIILGANLVKRGLLNEGLQQSLENLKLFETIKDTVNMATTYLDICAIYAKLKMYDMATQYNYKALHYSILTKDTINIWGCYNNATLPKSEGNNTDTILYYARKINLLFQQWSNKSDYYTSHTAYCYGHALFVNNKLDSVPYYLSIAKKLCVDKKLHYDLLIFNCNLDEKLKRPYTDINSIKMAYQEAIKENYISAIQTFSEVLIKNEIKHGNYKKAFNYLQYKTKNRDSSWTIETKIELSNLDKKYQTATKEKIIAMQNAKLEKSKFQITALLASLIGLVFLTVTLFIYQRKKETQAETKRQEQFTFQLFENTEEERKRIASDLHDGISHELLTLKNKAARGLAINGEEIENVINEVRQVSRDLFPAMFDNVGLEASIESLCERMTASGLFTTCDINYDIKLSKIKELQLYRIIQEALNNTLKHAKANAAKVTIYSKETQLHVEIKDNGIGFDITEKLNNNDTSFGIQSLMQRSKAIGSKSIFESNETGTKLLLKTPPQI